MLISPSLIGLVAGFLLFGYAVLISKYPRYEEIDDRYASAFSTVGLVIILVVSGGLVDGILTAVLEFAAYLLAITVGTLAFRRITRKPKRYKTA